MSDTPTPEELDAQITLRLQRFKQVISDIRAVLRVDLASYIARETKRAFLEQPAVARALSDDRVSALKRAASETGAASASRVDAALEDESLWTSITATPTNARELNEAGAVWTHITSVEDDLKALLGEYGFSGDDVRYKPPAFFVNGLFLPSLTEHLWRLLQEVSQLREQKQTLVDDTVRAELEARWAEA